MSVYVVSDTHFGHKLCAKLRGFNSVEDHDTCIIDNWNSVIKAHDTVWHLGDVAFSAIGLAKVSKLNGTKHLVLGNHDTRNIRQYCEYFSKIVSFKNYKNLAILTHIPISSTQFNYRWEDRLNVHGHIHNKEHLLSVDRYRCVCLEHIGMTPIEIDHIIE